jgi:hypothetical protein
LLCFVQFYRDKESCPVSLCVFVRRFIQHTKTRALGAAGQLFGSACVCRLGAFASMYNPASIHKLRAWSFAAATATPLCAYPSHVRAHVSLLRKS